MQISFQMAQSAGTAKYTDTISIERSDSHNECPAYENKQSDREALETLGEAEYPFIAITSRSTLVPNGSTR